VGSDWVPEDQQHRRALPHVPTGRAAALLDRHALANRFRSRPAEALEALQEHMADDGEVSDLLPFAELAFIAGARADEKAPLGGRPFHLTCVIATWAHLDAGVPARRDFARDLYNEAMERWLTNPWTGEGERPDAVSRRIGGRVRVDLREGRSGGFRGRRLRYLPTRPHELRGVSVRARREGIGSTWILEEIPHRAGPTGRFLPERTLEPRTVLVRTGAGVRDLARAEIRVVVEATDPRVVDEIRVAGVMAPLAADFSTPLAAAVEKRDMFRLDLGGLLYPDDYSGDMRLELFRPYDPAKIPVVFVHGLYSNPATWLEMVNRLGTDPVLREHYQVLHFAYPSGLPIAVSAGMLREELLEFRRIHDPEGDDANFDRMIIVGHSMGGILTRLMVSQGGEPLMDTMLEVKAEELDLTPAQEKLVDDLIDFDPLPFVSRVVFIASPQHGAEGVLHPVAGWIAAIIGSPKALAGLWGRTMKQLPFVGGPREALPPNSLTSLRPDNPLIIALNENRELGPAVPFHLIIGIDGDEQPPEGDDGWVDYRSAYMDGAESTLVVRSGHAAHMHPVAVEELRRILHKHLQASSTR
jgi:pimeloyl-ACP methyl ester carboxylesterase